VERNFASLILGIDIDFDPVVDQAPLLFGPSLIESSHGWRRAETSIAASHGEEQSNWCGLARFFFFLPLSCLHIFNPTMDVVWVAEGVCTFMMTM